MKGGRLVLVAAAAFVLVAAGVAAAAILLVHGRSSAAPLVTIDAADPAVPAAVQSRLGLSTLGRRPAPGLTLVDQRGRTVSLASLRGKVVVLEFFDPVCTDICPIVSQEYVEANRLLGAAARRAAFVAVNVNQYHRSVAAVAGFSRKHGLDGIPSWHFLTGPTVTLQKIWKAYGVAVQPNPSGDVVHSSLVYFIDAKGRERYLAMPDRNKKGIGAWAHGIAAVVRALAPAA
ncbi:MAG TPA: SCO family protein [Gaiellaceae bacterium]|nr:SCO family protein [Gaiellaceae bacterium]